MLIPGNFRFDTWKKKVCCGEPAPSGCDSACGSTKEDIGCGCDVARDEAGCCPDTPDAGCGCGADLFSRYQKS